MDSTLPAIGDRVTLIDDFSGMEMGTGTVKELCENLHFRIGVECDFLPQWARSRVRFFSQEQVRVDNPA